MDASVDGGIQVRGGGVLSHDSQSWVEIGQSSWGQGATASHKLDESLCMCVRCMDRGDMNQCMCNHHSD